MIALAKKIAGSIRSRWFAREAGREFPAFPAEASTASSWSKEDIRRAAKAARIRAGVLTADEARLELVLAREQDRAPNIHPFYRDKISGLLSGDCYTGSAIPWCRTIPIE